MRALAILPLLFGAACSGDRPNFVAEALIDTSGGTLALGRLTIDFAPGAVAEPTRFTLAVASPADLPAELRADAVDVYRLDPPHFAFGGPVVATFAGPAPARLAQEGGEVDIPVNWVLSSDGTESKAGAGPVAEFDWPVGTGRTSGGIVCTGFVIDFALRLRLFPPRTDGQLGIEAVVDPATDLTADGVGFAFMVDKLDSGPSDTLGPLTAGTGTRLRDTVGAPNVPFAARWASTSSACRAATWRWRARTSATGRTA